MSDATYHERIKGQKRAASVQAAMELFLEQGYDRTSLLQVAKRADVSTGTLFKRFPTKAALFEAIVEEFWTVEATCEAAPPAGNPAKGLRKIGLDYAQRMRRPEMQAIYRLIIAEAPRFPDLGQMLFDKGIGPYITRLSDYLTLETKGGHLYVPNIPATSREFLALVAGQALWPELLVPGCGGTDAEAAKVVDRAVAMMLALYGKKRS